MMRGGHFAHAASIPEGKAANSTAVARRLLTYLAPFKIRMAVVLLLTVVGAAFGAASPYLIGRAVDQFISRGDSAGLAIIMLLLFGSYVGAMAARVIQGYMMGWVAQNTLAKVRGQIFRKLHRLPMAYFDKHDAGDLMSRLVNDVDTINNLLSMGLVMSLASVLGLVGIVVAMFALHWQLALAAGSVIPVMHRAAGLQR